MHRLERLQAILLQLQSRRLVRAQDIADKYGISLRTVYRDIRALEESGVPIAAEAGVGYSLAEGYALPPVQFTQAEAAALFTAEKLLEKMGDASVNKELQSAMNKIRSVLRNTERDFLETLEQSMQVHTWRPQQDKSYPNHFISTIQQSLVQQRLISLEYFSLHSNEINERQVEPIGLCYLTGSWHLIAWCRLRKDIRDFRVDRIRSLQLLDELYEKRKRQSLDDYLKGTASPKDLQKVVIRFDNSILRFLHEQKYYFGLVEEKQLSKQMEMTFFYPSLDSFARWLIMWEDKTQVIGPPGLKKLMKHLSKAVYEHYKK
ncbi:MAG: YafY family transcriptional regulator [Bacteroidia bacterium]|nr:YafY family transcriptional regulator [Bacteroidia bacterium]MBP7260027.1 YafY family transcriptional regulator [Bacteroidia bacterium]MBP9179734.1 YafY family transcriptional regulator [Bacteroidia bacterium]MBP9723867.1 YafY family transcriptional regulator [Bacteroidia bacterium]